MFYSVRNNNTGKIYRFGSMQKAINFQEYLVFTCGIDAEIL
jgi:hypothetical protein